MQSIQWKIELHTQEKHAILREYLRAWFPILGHKNPRLLYVDGYAGPGSYQGGQAGSPVIAMKIAHDFINNCQSRNKPVPNITCVFIEKDKKRCKSLEDILDQMPKSPNIDYLVENEQFIKTKLLELVSRYGAPTFIFIDPFGYSGIPMSFISNLVKIPRTEVFINFMAGPVNRWLRRSGQERVLTGLFGTSEWQTISKNTSQRIEKLRDLYHSSLNNSAKHVRSFAMRGTNNVVTYYLFYGTQHPRGLEKMKEAMWKSDPTGNYSFSDATNPNQLVLFQDPDFSILRNLIHARFSGQTVSVKTLLDFVNEHTPFLKKHLRDHALTPMEQDGHIIVTRTSRKGSYPENTQIQIIPSN